ncbi:MAG: hypothetical protein HYT75_02330 [Deltaproteobacteria bacterium]|nr:hypothetical protein [Deltaproteobacteria bacterium]
MIEGLNIYGGMGDCLLISGKDNTVINNKFSGCGYYGISAYGDALEQLKTDYNLATQLLCSNTVLVTATVPFTNIDLNNNKKDDYKEFNDMIDGVSICSIWKSSGGKTVCKEGYKLDETNACSLCDEATNYYKDNAGNCVLCSGENKKLVDGQCICKDDTVEEWPVGSGLCISKCAEGETRNAEGACISDCPNQNEAMLDGACACKEGFGRYFYNGMTKESALAFPCVDCGDFKDTTTDRLYCLCGLDQHRSLSGSCVSTCPENSQPEAGGKACICDQCYTYTWEDAAKAPYCKPIEGCVAKLSLDDCVALGKADGKNYTLNPEGTACVTAAGGNPDCGCNFNAMPSSLAEVLLPYIMIAASGVGISLLKRKKS